MDVTKILKDGFDQLLKDIVPLIVAGLLVAILTPLTLGILGGPMMAGLYRMVLLRLRENKTPEIGDVFYFDNFGRYVVAFYALGIMISVGFLLLVVPGLYLLAIWFYVIPLMIDRDLSVGDAMKESKALVDGIGLGPQFGLVAVLAVIGGALGSLTKGVGSALAAPYTTCCALIAYEQVINGAGTASSASEEGA